MTLPKPQLRLSTLLVLMLLAGVLCAWLADHVRQERRQKKLEVELKMRAAQITDLKLRLQTRGATKVQVWSYWSSADNFIEALKQAEENEFLEMAPSFARSDEAVFIEGIERVLELLQSAEPQVRARAITVISFALQGSRDGA